MELLPTGHLYSYIEVHRHPPRLNGVAAFKEDIPCRGPTTKKGMPTPSASLLMVRITSTSDGSIFPDKLNDMLFIDPFHRLRLR